MADGLRRRSRIAVWGLKSGRRENAVRTVEPKAGAGRISCLGVDLAVILYKKVAIIQIRITTLDCIIADIDRYSRTHP